jgi:hypothetical protein
MKKKKFRYHIDFKDIKSIFANIIVNCKLVNILKASYQIQQIGTT